MGRERSLIWEVNIRLSQNSPNPFSQIFHVFFSNEYVNYFEVGVSEKIDMYDLGPLTPPTPPWLSPVMLRTVGHRSSLSTPFLNAANKTFALCPACKGRGKKSGSWWRSVVESMDRWMGFQAKTAQGNPNVLRHLTLGEAGLVLLKNYQQNHRFFQTSLKSRWFCPFMKSSCQKLDGCRPSQGMPLLFAPDSK